MYRDYYNMSSSLSLSSTASAILVCGLQQDWFSVWQHTHIKLQEMLLPVQVHLVVLHGLSERHEHLAMSKMYGGATGMLCGMEIGLSSFMPSFFCHPNDVGSMLDGKVPLFADNQMMH